jgi:polyisoprenoid-binding protein YceI
VSTHPPVILPAPGRWSIDPGHAEVGFVGRHFGLTKIRGRFTGVTGTVELSTEPGADSVEVTIDMATVTTGDATRDDHLRSADLFDVEHHRHGQFVSTAVDIDGDRGVVHGVLTLKGISRPVALEVEYRGAVTDPWGNDRAVFAAATRINRDDWGIGWNMVLEAGGLLVSKEIAIEIEVELIRQPS